MKLPKAAFTLCGCFAASVLFTGAFLCYSIQRKSIAGVIAAAAAAVSSVGLATVIEDYCRAASFHPREYFDLNRVINDFFAPQEPEFKRVSHD